jgi:hypothetical protein
MRSAVEILTVLTTSAVRKVTTAAMGMYLHCRLRDGVCDRAHHNFRIVSIRNAVMRKLTPAHDAVIMKL